MDSSTKRARKCIMLLALATAVAVMLAFGATSAFAEEADQTTAQDVLSTQGEVTPQTATITMVLEGNCNAPYTGNPVPYQGDIYTFDASYNLVAISGLTYAYYTDKNCTVPTTTANSGSISESTAPANKGIWYVKVSYAGSEDYGPCSAITGYAITTVDSDTGLAYVVLGDTASYGAGAYVLGYTGTATDIVVPAKLGGANVVSVTLESLSLTSLDSSACGANLKYLDCTTNEILSLDVSKNTALVSLSCGDNKLTSLNFGDVATLGYLACGMNELTSLDVSKNR